MATAALFGATGTAGSGEPGVDRQVAEFLTPDHTELCLEQYGQHQDGDEGTERHPEADRQSIAPVVVPFRPLITRANRVWTGAVFFCDLTRSLFNR